MPRPSPCGCVGACVGASSACSSACSPACSSACSSSTASRPASDIRLSKKLSSLLRHRIDENGLGSLLRPDGYVRLDAVLKTPPMRSAKASEADIARVVETCEKQRFSMRCEGGVTYIRANQGHRYGRYSSHTQPIPNPSPAPNPHPPPTRVTYLYQLVYYAQARRTGTANTLPTPHPTPAQRPLRSLHPHPARAWPSTPTHCSRA